MLIISENSLLVFTLGCIGAMAPEILRMYNLRNNPKLQWSWSYIGLSIPFILLGGLISLMMEPKSLYTAFYAGLTAPIVINTASKNFVDSQTIKKSRPKSDEYSVDVDIDEINVDIEEMNPGRSKSKLGFFNTFINSL